MIPSNKRPFDLIASILPKCVSSAANFSTDQPNTSSINISTQQTSNTNTPSKDSAENLSGSAGYCFWETQEGYKFKSIDRMCSSGGQFGGDAPKDTFTYQLANVENQKPTKNIIEYNYVNEIDVLKKMRYGVYASLMVFFKIGRAHV